MAGGYSLDLRTRVMKDVQNGLSPDEAAQKYSISSRSIYHWKQLLQDTGSLTPRQSQTGPKPKLKSFEAAIRQAVKDNSDLTLESLKDQLNLPGCLQTLANALHRWEITLKKSRSGR